MSHPLPTTATAPDAATTRYLTARWVLPISAAPIENGYVAVKNGRIQAVGKLENCPAPQPLPPENSLLTPGLVNTHTHLEQSFPQTLPRTEGENFTQWLLAVIALNRAHATPDEKRSRCRTGGEELLRGGTTCVNDIASDRISLEVLDSLGLRGIVSLEFFHPGFETLNIQPIVEAYQRFKAGFEEHPLLQAGLSPHSPYNVSPAAWQAVLDTCRPPFIHTHLAECRDEVAFVQGLTSCFTDLHQAVLRRSFGPQQPALSPTAYLQAFNLLSPGLVLAHAVHTDAADRAMIAGSGAAIAHCPRSNCHLHGETLSLSDWDSADIPVGLGTDGRLSTEDLDVRAEARVAAKRHGWTDAQALKAATLSGAQALGMQDAIGSLEADKWADLVLWHLPADTEHLPPQTRWLHPDTTAHSVWVAGQCRWQREGRS